METQKNYNQSTIRVTTTIKEEAENFVGDKPRPYLSMSKLNDEALRKMIEDLHQKYPNLKKKSGGSRKS